VAELVVKPKQKGQGYAVDNFMEIKKARQISDEKTHFND
jgi:hypothetical protein